MSGHLAAVAEYAALHTLIFPCHWIIETAQGRACSCGDTGCKSPGKHPIKELAPNGHKDASSNPETINSWWTLYPQANPAMSLAESGLVVIDIDPRNGGDGTFDDLEAKHGKITSDVEQITGGAGRHIVYVAETDARYPGKLGAGVDVKHHGYIMVWPSNHMLGNYEWEASSDLMGGMIPSPAPKFLAMPAGDEYNTDIKPAAPGLGLEALLETELDEIRSALLFIPNFERDDWLFAGMVCHAIDSGRAGFQLWEDWSSSSEKFDAQDQARVWFSFHGKPNQRNKESLFFKAAESGWINPLKKLISPDVQAAALRVLQSVTAKETPSATTKQVTTSTFTPFPVHGLDEVAALIGASSYVNYPDASRLAAVQLACLAASRRYVGDNGEGCHVYFGLSSVSVGMVRYTVNALQTILTQAGMRQLFSSSRKSTAGIIHDHLIKRPAHLYCVEDFGKMLQQSKKQFGNGSMEHALDTLGSIYSKSILQIDQDDLAKNKSDPENRVVYAPALSMLALASQDQLSEMMRKSEIGSGLMINMLMAVCDESEAITRNEPTPILLPDWLMHQLAVMRGFNPADRKADTTFDFAGDRGDFPPEQIVVPMAKTALHDAAILALSDKRAMIPLLHGARVIMRRIAISLAAWGNPMAPIVTPEIMAFASSFVIAHVNRFIDEYDLLSVSDDGKVSIYQQIISCVVKRGALGAKWQNIRDEVPDFKNKLDTTKRKDLIQALDDDGEIFYHRIGKEKRYIAARFMSNEASAEDCGKTRNEFSALASALNTNGFRASSQTRKNGNKSPTDIH